MSGEHRIDLQSVGPCSTWTCCLRYSNHYDSWRFDWNIDYAMWLSIVHLFLSFYLFSLKIIKDGFTRKDGKLNRISCALLSWSQPFGGQLLSWLCPGGEHHHRGPPSKEDPAERGTQAQGTWNYLYLLKFNSSGWGSYDFGKTSRGHEIKGDITQ